VSRALAPAVLVVEDSDEDFDTAQEALQQAGLKNEVRRAATGGRCLDLLRGKGGAPLRPAFVLMSLNTPGLDGREALKQIKGDARLNALPVIVFSTSSYPGDLEFFDDQVEVRRLLLLGFERRYRSSRPRPRRRACARCSTPSACRSCASS
jgi:CheY-like chemotaxis protein